MWNCCMRNNQISAQDDNEEDKKVERLKTCSLFKLEMAPEKSGMKKKKVRLNVKNDIGGKGDHGNSTSGPLRIKLVVTKEELRMMLSNKKENDAQKTSLKELLKDMKLRDKRVSGIEVNGGGKNSWRPALESIPEDHSMK